MMTMTHAAYRGPESFPFTLMRGHGRKIPVVTVEQREAYLRRFPAQGDPAADAVVTMFRRLPTGRGRAMFELALEQGIGAVSDAPAELTTLFGELDAVPCWVDTDQLDLGARVIGRTGAAGLAALSMGALLGGYLAARATKPLIRTGDLDRMVGRRIAETTQWFVDTTAVGGLRRYAPGFRSTVRVRLMHALVRAGMTRRSDWDWARWDHPVNQSQLAGTNMLFAVALLSGSELLGLHFTTAERAAVCHLWRYVGWLMGVDPAILPADEHDNWRLLQIQGSYEFGNADDDSRALARALIHAIGELTVGSGQGLATRARRAGAERFLFAYARAILGPTDANFLGVPNDPPMRSAVALLATAVRGLECGRRVVPGATRLCELSGRRRWVATARQMMTQNSGDGRYRRHDRMAKTPDSLSSAVTTPVLQHFSQPTHVVRSST